MEKVDARILEKLCLRHFKKKMDQDFFCRMWSQDLGKYKSRVEQLGFTDMEHVMDAGSGFGQWSYSLGQLNRNVLGLEYDSARVAASTELKSYLNFGNVRFEQGSIEKVNIEDNFFDGIFCFGTIMCTDYKKTLVEMHRILKKGGIFFFNASDLGWFIYNILENHNPSEDFSPRQWAINSIQSTIRYYSTGVFENAEMQNIVMPRDLVVELLKNMKFNIIHCGRQGSFALKGEANWEVDRPEKRYGVFDTYEVICSKE